MRAKTGLAFDGALRRLSWFAVDVVLPPSCPICRAAVVDEDALCGRCWSQLRFIEPPLCPVYGTPFAYELGEGMVSAEALADPPPFRRARSAAIYGDGARRLVHQLKYHDRPDLAQVIARSMQRAGRELLADATLVVPVPLYYWRLWQRRFNQSAALAASLSRLSGVPHDPLVLTRVRRTRQQVGLSAAQRQENVRGAFRVPDAMRGRIAQRPVLLVDDVYTSGATVKAAARALLRGGASSVDVLTFARVTP
jgi:ComF family protein